MSVSHPKSSKSPNFMVQEMISCIFTAAFYAIVIFVNISNAHSISPQKNHGTQIDSLTAGKLLFLLAELS